MPSTIPDHVALLRAVNVGGRKVAMAQLRQFANDMGLANAATLLQSGNLVFSAPDDAAGLEARLEAAAEQAFGFRIGFMLRSAAEWRAIIAANPFTEAAREDPSHLVVLALKQAPPEGALERLRAAITGPECAELQGREAYVHYPVDIGHSKLTNAVLERHLGPCTGRNWNTVLKLMALLGG